MKHEALLSKELVTNHSRLCRVYLSLYFLRPVFGGLVRDAWNGIMNGDVSADAQGKICKVVFIISFSSFGLV